MTVPTIRQLPKGCQKVAIMNFQQLVYVCAFGVVFSHFVESAAVIKSIQSGSQTSVLGNSISTLPTFEDSNAVLAVVNGETKLKQAACIPEFRSVKVSNESNATVKLSPSCVRINQCGGCCASDLKECQAIEQTAVNVEVHVLKWDPDIKSFVPADNQNFTVWEHKKCACQCKVKPTDCTPDQEYKEDECRCNCKDESQKDKCSETGLIWNPKECKCEPKPTSTES